MSKLSEYSKFDHLASDSEDDDDNNDNKEQANVVSQQPSPPTATAPTDTSDNTPPSPCMTRDAQTKHILFQIGGQTIYEWEQTLDEVVLYIPPPPFPNFSASLLECQIMPKHLRVRLRGNVEFFIDEPTFGSIDTKASTWCLEPVETTKTMPTTTTTTTTTGSEKKKIQETTMIAIHLIKANKGVVWDAVLCGKFPSVTLNPFDKNQIQSELMLERFQEENPGFDFRGAEFNGSVPDPRNFMGGVKYS